MSLPRGLYDQLVTESLAAQVDAMPGVQTDNVSGSDASRLLLDLLGRSLERIVSELPGTEPERIASALALVNDLLVSLKGRASTNADLVDRVSPPVRRLRAVHTPGVEAPTLPETGLAQPWLFTAAKASPSLFQEIRRESAECDRIDILVSFITMSGVRKLIDVLQSATAPGTSGTGRTRIRVLTTTCIGATEVGALDELAKLNGCTVKVSLDGQRTRLHAKAWIFGRDSGFGTAYVGSANLSAAAMLGGLEWTVKFTERGQEALYARARAHFETLWEDDEFQRYNPYDDESRRALVAALQRESGAGSDGPLTFFDITPKRYQQEMLDGLRFEREHGRHRNLLVAATGTGKTVVAALDYRASVHAAHGARPRLLFVAHREQLLRQAMATYRQVLRDGSFGELLVGGSAPAQHAHLFASIDSITSRDIVNRFGADYWHTVVIDECHRLAASRLDTFARSVQPTVLLGLTATPERADGQSLAPYFTSRPDGSPAAELRLWDALDLQLLAPFEYFGCDDTSDFSQVPWNTAGEREAIDRVVTGDQIRARTVMQEWNRLSGNAARTRALVFCVTVRHAEFMTAQFNAAGLKAVCVTGDTSPDERRRAPELLKRGEICAIVTVDLYNEGVDIPEADTLLFLRPTGSPVVFQQQLGRGLRLSEGKSSCLVLDFVGQHNAEFRFDRLLSSITGLNRRELLTGAEQGFSMLPSGCHIHLQSRTREQVLGSLRGLVNQNWRRLKAEVVAYASTRGTRGVTLADFVRDQQVDLGDIYRDTGRSGWTTLRREAGVLTGTTDDAAEAAMSRGFRHLLHADDPGLIDTMRRVAERGAEYTPENSPDAARAQMLAYQVDSSTVQSYGAWTRSLSQHPYCQGELGELADILESRVRVSPRPIVGLEDMPLSLHASYRIREILTAAGWLTAERRTPFQAGVLPLKERKTELLFVTLDKSQGYHDRIAYHDYAISPTHFHWQTQNAAGPNTASGRRYIESGTNGWSFQLFVRSNQNAAYMACGPVRITGPEDVTGDRPMNVRWTLVEPLPIHLFREFSVLRGE